MLMERRRGTRYPVRLDCSLSSVSKPTASMSGETVNMSSRGVLVALKRKRPVPAMLRVGGRARVLLKLPPVPYFRGCWLDCKGEVVRVVEQDGTHLVGLRVSRHQFRPAERDDPAALQTYACSEGQPSLLPSL